MLPPAAGPAAAQQGTVKKQEPRLPPEQGKVTQAWAHSLAIQAATNGSSTVGMYNLPPVVPSLTAVFHGLAPTGAKSG